MNHSGYLLRWSDPDPEVLLDVARQLLPSTGWHADPRVLIAPVPQSDVVYVARTADEGSPDPAFARALSARLGAPVIAFQFDEADGGSEWVSAWEAGTRLWSEALHWTVPRGWFGGVMRRPPQAQWPLSRVAAGLGLTRQELFSFEFEFLPTLCLRLDTVTDLVTFALTWAPLRNLRTTFPRLEPNPAALRASPRRRPSGRWGTVGAR